MWLLIWQCVTANAQSSRPAVIFLAALPQLQPQNAATSTAKWYVPGKKFLPILSPSHYLKIEIFYSPIYGVF
jgi:hypothetical protein